MNTSGESPSPAIPDHLLIIAGRGVYPLELAQCARKAGVSRISVIAFRGETERSISRYADQVWRIPLGRVTQFLDTASASGARQCVMAGQIAPHNLFTLRLDAAAIEILRSLPERNAHTIFGALVARLQAAGMSVQPASSFMQSAMPAPGLLSQRAPNAREAADILLGRRVAAATSGLEIGQTVVVKEGTVLAVEAFEGTDEAILRAGRVGGKGAVVVKTAKRGHDMRFDIPVIGRRTLSSIRRAHVTALAVEAGRTILLERSEILEEANRMGLAFVAYSHTSEETP